MKVEPIITHDNDVLNKPSVLNSVLLNPPMTTSKRYDCYNRYLSSESGSQTYVPKPIIEMLDSTEHQIYS